MKPSVAWIGLGTMGGPMANNLVKAGFPLTVYNRTREKIEPLVKAGATAASSPREAAACSEITMVMVSSPEAFESVLGGADGILEGLPADSLLIDMGTSGAASARRAARLAGERGASFVDAPVLGSRNPAELGKLIVMAGGAARNVERARGVLAPLARSIHHVGGVGCGQAMKLAANLMLAHLLSGLAGAIALARAAGLSPIDLVDVLEAGLASPYFRAKGMQMIEGSFEPQFTLDLVRKDLGLIREALEEARLAFPTIGPISEMMEEAARRGWGREDGSAVIKLWWPELSASNPAKG